MKYLYTLVLLFITASLFAEVDLWKGQRRFTPTKSLATAGAQNVGSDKTDGAYLNPATLITTDKKYMLTVESSYSNTDAPTQFMISAVDSRTSVVAGGMFASYYNYNKEVDGKKTSYTGLQTGLSYAYPVGGLVIGIAGRYIQFEENDKSYIKTVTFDLGLTYRISPNIKIGGVIYNLTDQEYIETPMKFVAGISLGNPENFFVLNFDFVTDISSSKLYGNEDTALYEYHIGLEIKPIEELSLLAGYEINNVLDENFWATGIEWFVPESRIELTLAYLQSTSKEENKNFNFSLRFYF